MECFVVDDPMTFFLFGLLCVPLIAFLNICTTKIIIMMKHRHGGRGRQFCQFLQGGGYKYPKKYQQYTCALFFTACSIFLLYLDDVMHAFEKNRVLVIWDRYFSGRMQMISTKKKGNERKECQNIFKSHLFDSVFSVCSFAHLLFVHMVF